MWSSPSSPGGDSGGCGGTIKMAGTKGAGRGESRKGRKGEIEIYRERDKKRKRERG